MDIEMIPLGAENAVTRQALVSQTGMCDREVRREISRLREKFPICSHSGKRGQGYKKGYYRPRTATELKAYIFENESRIKALRLLVNQAVGHYATLQNPEIPNLIPNTNSAPAPGL